MLSGGFVFGFHVYARVYFVRLSPGGTHGRRGTVGARLGRRRRAKQNRGGEVGITLVDVVSFSSIRRCIIHPCEYISECPSPHDRKTRSKMSARRVDLAFLVFVCLRFFIFSFPRESKTVQRSRGMYRVETHLSLYTIHTRARTMHHCCGENHLRAFVCLLCYVLTTAVRSYFIIVYFPTFSSSLRGFATALIYYRFCCSSCTRPSSARPRRGITSYRASARARARSTNERARYRFY